MQTIEVTPEVYDSLARMAKPFEPASSVIAKLIEHFEGAQKKEDAWSASATEQMLFQPASLPPLRHTRLISATFSGKQPDKPQWNSVVKLALIVARKHLASWDAVKKAAQANLVEGVKTNEGYQVVEGEGFSFQGVSADDAGRIIVRLARFLNCTAAMEWEWRDKEDAHAPGRIGRVVVAKNGKD